MGGKLSFIIRRESGEIHKWYLWTGIEDLLVNTVDFNNGKYDSCINKFIKEIYKEEDDKTCLNRDTLSPEWYGILVYDFKDKIIYSMQSYNDPGVISLMCMSPSIILEKQQANTLSKLIQNNSLDVFTDTSKSTYIGSIHDVFGTSLTMSNLKDLIKQSQNNKFSFSYQGKEISIFNTYLISKKMRDFTVKYYSNDNPSDIFELQDTLIASGFNLTEEDKKEWSQYAEELKILNNN